MVPAGGLPLLRPKTRLGRQKNQFSLIFLLSATQLIFCIYVINIIFISGKARRPSALASSLKVQLSPGQLAQLFGAMSHPPKGCGFDSQLGHIPRLQIWSLVCVYMGGNQLMFLSLSLSFFPSLSLLKVINIFLGED